MTASDATELAGDAPMALYRLYGSDGRLLYIGVTHSLKERFGQHAADKPWWPDVARRTVEWHGDRDLVLAAEAEAIEGERPAYNIVRPLLPGNRHGRHRYAAIACRPPGAIRERLTAFAAESGTPVNAIVTAALDAYLPG